MSSTSGELNNFREDVVVAPKPDDSVELAFLPDETTVTEDVKDERKLQETLESLRTDQYVEERQRAARAIIQN